jgi:uncharacterized membrane protein YeiH
MQSLIYILDLFGVVVFAITGSLAAGRKHMDLFGVAVLAVVTALGGGTIRDLVIDAGPVFWVSNPVYIIAAAAAALMTFVISRFYDFPRYILLTADAFGLAVFTVVGIERSLAFEISPGIAVVMGIMTGVAGGMLRDVLSGEIPLILRREIYATASLCGAVVFFIILTAFQSHTFAVFASILVTLALRLSAIKWNLSLPVFISRDEKSDL